LGRPPDTASAEELRRYQLHLVDEGISPASLNAAISGLKFFFDITLDHAELMARMQPVHLPRTLPVDPEPRRGGPPDRGGGEPEASNCALAVAYGARDSVSARWWH
jgi:integrase/recombinase XerD